MTLKTISADAARNLQVQGAVVVDIRSADEYARDHIPQARHLPLTQLEQGGGNMRAGVGPVIFYCRTGARTQMNAPLLSRWVNDDAYVLAGGLDAWKRAGLPVVTDARQPMELQRQVQIAAGAIVFLGTMLGVAVSPWFLAIPGFIGAGLIFAGATGFCGLAHLLVKAPWNQRSAHQ